MFELTPDEWTAIRLSLRIATVATLVALPLGIATAWLLARKTFPGKAMLDDEHLLNGLNVHAGKITYEAVAKDLGYDYVPAAKALAG